MRATTDFLRRRGSPSAGKDKGHNVSVTSDLLLRSAMTRPDGATSARLTPPVALEVRRGNAVFSA